MHFRDLDGGVGLTIDAEENEVVIGLADPVQSALAQPY